jgi:hypothetical protein
MSNPLEELEQQLGVLRDRVRGVARRHHAGAYIYGPPGTAKSHTVQKTLDEEQIEYAYHAGHLTPLGLFELLADHSDKVIVLDDVSELLRANVALQILLAALGTQPTEVGVRVVRYRRQGRVEEVQFRGGIILLSNLELAGGPVLDAIRSRVHCLEYAPSDEQMEALLLHIASQGWRDVPPDECLDVAKFLIGESHKMGVRLDLRLLVDKALPDYLQYKQGHAETHWRDLVLAMLRARVAPLENTTDAHRTRWAEKQQEHALLRDILQRHATRKCRVAAWHEKTGKGERAYYRRLGELQFDNPRS